VLDFGQPVAIMLLGVLHLIHDAEDPWRIVDRLLAATPAGSYLTISHPAIDIHHSQADAQRVYNERVATPQTLRTRDQVARFFAGLELLHACDLARPGAGRGIIVAGLAREGTRWMTAIRATSSAAVSVKTSWLALRSRVERWPRGRG
jgi:hypothetical protein